MTNNDVFVINYTNTLKVVDKIRSNPSATAEDLAHADWLLETCRGDEIARRIGLKYPLNSQIALLMDKELKYTEWCEYQAYRAEVKNEVDAIITAILTNTEIVHGA